MTGQLEDLPPSVRYVYRELRSADEEELTRRELADRTEYSDRTVRRALKRLRERGLVDERLPEKDDGRKPRYAMAGQNGQQADV